MQCPPRHTEILYEVQKPRFMCLGVSEIAPLSTQKANISYKTDFNVLRGITTPDIIGMPDVRELGSLRSAGHRNC